MDTDALRSTRNAFYLQNYNLAIQEAQTLLNTKQSQLHQAATIYKQRAEAALNPSTSFPTHTSASQAIQQLQVYHRSDDKELALQPFDEWIFAKKINEPTVVICGAIAYIAEKRYKDALKALTSLPQLSLSNTDALEILSLQTVVHLSIGRIDLAQQNVKSMSDIDDDDTLTQLTSSWVNIIQGNSNEAMSLLQELMEKFGPSVVVLNALAVCELQNGNYTTAFSFLKQSRDLSLSEKSQNVSDITLLNTIISLTQMNRSNEILNKVQNEFSKLYPNHEEFRKLKQMENEFDRFKMNYKFK